MQRQGCEQSQYYQDDFLASHSAQPGSDEARRMTVTSGRKCCELYRKSGPLGSLVKTLLESSVWRSTRCYLTWKASATPAKRLLFRLVPSMPRTDGTEWQFWPTPVSGRPDQGMSKSQEERHSLSLMQAVQVRSGMWPTPTAMDAKGLDHSLRKGATSSRSILLAQKVAMFPTPTERDFKSADMNPYSNRFSQKTELNSVVGGQLNPTWVEWLMGFPLGWTDLSASETPSCHSSSTQSSGQ